MNEPAQSEMWQVEVSGQIYETDFAEMTQWIAEGALQPEDKVRRGNLRWIEARKVPTLVAFFNAKAAGGPPPVVVTTSTGTTDAPARSDTQPANLTSEPVTGRQTYSSTTNHTTQSTGPVFTDSSSCRNHSGVMAKYVCLSCSGSFCRDCTKSFGSSVSICGACGGMCKPKAELEAAVSQAVRRAEAISEGFGFGDFAAAIAYPFKFKPSLIIGALMFMFFTIGQGASSFGGIYMITASIFAYMLANMLPFGILANSIENFAHGKIGENFMPAYEDFSLWDDVIHPFFLSIGVYISSFGAFILILLIGMYLVMSAVSSQINNVRSELERTPGTPYYNVRDTLDQSKQVKDVLGNTEAINQERLDHQEAIEDGEVPAAINSEEEDFRKLNDMIADHRRQSLESAIGKSAETQEKEFDGMISGFLKLAAPFVIFGLLALVWGLFYFPAACAVAGYTRSFVATINPLVGLDTIRRLGFDYVKILFMCFLILLASGFISMVLGVVFSAFNMPGVGNLPAKAIGSLFSFYFWIVFSCILGFAIFKASDRLRLQQ